jgi:hypothetical protein
MTVMRAFERLTILSLSEHANYTPFFGLYFYVQRGASLRLVWMSKSAVGGNIEILDVRRVSVEHQSGGMSNTTARVPLVAGATP